jgi:hypothetical protein
MEALMTTTLKQTEAAPADYPDAPTNLSTAAAALDANMIWQRLEAYTAYRWTVRDVVWTVEGPGEWHPPLTPATIATVEIWADGAWSNITPDASPLGGYWLPGCGPYRFTGTAGGGTVPANVNEAFRRLAEYFTAKPGKAGARSEDIGAGSIRIAYSRDPAWMANAMQNSGAGDLLRNYRHV